MNSIKDILVIGGGLGGLMTGAILSKVGFKVTVLEKNRTVGGGLQCFPRHGKIFETGMHIMGGMLPGENVYRLCSWVGITDKLKIRLTDAECMDFLWFYEEGQKYSLPSGRLSIMSMYSSSVSMSILCEPFTSMPSASFLPSITPGCTTMYFS